MSDAPDACRVAALRILSYRFNSEAELRRKLRLKNFDAAEIEAVITNLRDEKWLDDDRFAGAFVRMRAAKRMGPERIRRELQAAGVSREVIERAVAENMEEDRTRTALVELFRKRRRMLARRRGEDYADSLEGRNKLAVYLLNQGYDARLVSSVVKETTVVDHE
jgi:regulatory protein